MLMLALAGSPRAGDDFLPSVLFLTGALGAEELDVTELERWAGLAARPLDINSAPRSRLLSSGLFSAWQVASIIDTRTRTGDILSATELSLMDGFDRETAAALSHFVTFRTRDAPGSRKRDRLSGEMMLRGAVRSASAGLRVPWGVKAELDIGDRAGIYWGTRTSYSEPSATPGTAHLELTPRRVPARLVLGDFSARFGQGLALWSGFSMSGFSSVQAFRRNGSGLGASTSFTRTLHGAAADADIGPWVISAAYSYPSTCIANATRHSRNASLGMTAVADLRSGSSAVSADWRAGMRSVSFFGEAALSKSASRPVPAALAGAIVVPRYGHRFSALLRWYPADYQAPYCGSAHAFSKARDEAGAAVGMQLPGLSATFDWAVHPSDGGQQQKLVAQCSHTFAAGDFTAVPSVRAAIRHKSASTRTDIRGDLSLTYGRMNISARANVLWCKDFAWLWNAGPAWKGEVLQAQARFTLFKVDEWDDRIWCYDPDVPGTFSIPAYYGRGYAISALAGWKGTLYVRLSVVEYPWTVPEKQGSAECKLQCRIRF